MIKQYKPDNSEEFHESNESLKNKDKKQLDDFFEAEESGKQRKSEGVY